LVPDRVLVPCASQLQSRMAVAVLMRAPGLTTPPGWGGSGGPACGAHCTKAAYCTHVARLAGARTGLWQRGQVAHVVHGVKVGAARAAACAVRGARALRSTICWCGRGCCPIPRRRRQRRLVCLARVAKDIVLGVGGRRRLRLQHAAQTLSWADAQLNGADSMIGAM